MPNPCLTESDKKSVVYKYTSLGLNQTELARTFNCSRRTIYSTLISQGVLNARRVCSPKENQVLDLVKKHRLSLDDLQKFLKRRAARKSNGKK